jgi:hypothetical protein
MDYNSNIKRITAATNILQQPPISPAPSKKDFLEWVNAQSWLKKVNFSLKNEKGEPVSTNIFTKFFSADANFLAQAATIDYSPYGFQVQDLGSMRGRSGSVKGLMNRMGSAFADTVQSPQIKVSPSEREGALALLKTRDGDEKDLFLRAKQLCEASSYDDFVSLSQVDMSTSSGPRFFQKSSEQDPFASVATSKTTVMEEYGEEVYADICELMKACSSRDDSELRKLFKSKPALFAIALRGKEEVVNFDYKEAPEKCRPYWAIDLVHVLMASPIFDLIFDAIVPFWEDPESISALGFNWFHDSETGTNGAEKILDFIESTPEGEVRSMGFGDDTKFVANTSEGIFTAGPDISHLDMSLQDEHKAHVKEFVHRTFLKYYPDYRSTWVYGYVNLYFELAFKQFLLLFPHGIVARKAFGLPSGLPGTTLIDLAAMTLFHYFVKIANWETKTPDEIFTESATRCGFIVKPETMNVCQYDPETREDLIPFLGMQIVQYKYPGIKETLMIPCANAKTLITSAIFPKYQNPKTSTDSAAWHILRLYGLAISGGLFFHEFSTPAMAAVTAHSKTILKAKDYVGGDKTIPIVTQNLVDGSSFTVTKGPSYLQQLVGKKFTEITLPRTSELLLMLYPSLINRNLDTFRPTYNTKMSVSVEDDDEGCALQFSFGDKKISLTEPEEVDEIFQELKPKKVIAKVIPKKVSTKVAPKAPKSEEPELELDIPSSSRSWSDVIILPKDQVRSLVDDKPKMEAKKIVPLKQKEEQVVTKPIKVTGVVRTGNPAGFKLDNVVYDFMKKSYPKQIETYLQMVDLLNKTNAILKTDSEYEELFSPIVLVMEEFVVAFQDKAKQKFIAEGDQKRVRMKQDAETLMAQVRRVISGMSWGDEPAPVFPLMSGATSNFTHVRLDPVNPPKVKPRVPVKGTLPPKEPEAGTQLKFHTWFSTLQPIKATKLRARVLKDKPYTKKEHITLNALKTGEKAATAIAMLGSRMGEDWKNLSDEAFKEKYLIPR